MIKTVQSAAQKMLTAKQEESGEVERLYVEEQRGLVESARLLKCSPQALARWLDDHGFERRDIAAAQDLRREREEQDQKELTEKVVALHHKGLILREIAAETKVSQSKVWYILKKGGLTGTYSTGKTDGEGNRANSPDPSALASIGERQRKLVQERRRLILETYNETDWSIVQISRKLQESHAFIRQTLGTYGLIARP